MLRAVDAAPIDLVHDLLLRNLPETHLREETRRERQDQRLGRFERLDPFQHPLDQLRADVGSPQFLLHGDGLDFNGGVVGIADFRQNLPARARHDFVVENRQREAVDILDDIVRRTCDQLIRITPDQLADSIHIIQRCGPDHQLCQVCHAKSITKPERENN